MYMCILYAHLCMCMYVCMYVYLSVDVCIYIVISKFWFHPEFVMVGFWEGRWVGGGGGGGGGGGASLWF